MRRWGEPGTMKQIIFTDLDGTLLDSKTYSYEKSLAVINRLKESGIPIIFCSAKTRAEQEVYRRELGLFHPFVVENGGAVFIPRGDIPFSFDYHKTVDDLLAIELAIPRSSVKKVLARIGKESDLRFKGISDELFRPLYLKRLVYLVPQDKKVPPFFLNLQVKVIFISHREFGQ
jgi:predicted mannosyl-3-phosphoglycerate phosphatase (HAD superfamily)